MVTQLIFPLHLDCKTWDDFLLFFCKTDLIRISYPTPLRAQIQKPPQKDVYLRCLCFFFFFFFF